MGFSPRSDGLVVDNFGLLALASGPEARAIDAHAISSGLSANLLMEQAGSQSVAFLTERFGHLVGRALVLCGPGQNGGDGYVVARHLYERGWHVSTLALAPPNTQEAKHNAALWQACLTQETGAPSPRATHFFYQGDTATLPQGPFQLVVDALFGTGLSRPLDARTQDLLTHLEHTEHLGLKVALDMPSGLHASTGEILAKAFKADLTLTFGVAKRGLYLQAGPETSGEVHILPIGWPKSSFEAAPPRARLLRYGLSAQAPELTRLGVFSLASRLASFRPQSHKGSYGHIAILGGEAGLEGAGLLAARAALRGGAGLVTWVTHTPHTRDTLPEIMTRQDGVIPPRATVLAIGPGLSQGDYAHAALDGLVNETRPVVLDADALNVLASHPYPLGPGLRLLTPHPLEAARLLRTDVQAIQADRFGALEELQTRFPNAVIVLKGANPLVGGLSLAPTLVEGDVATLAVGGSGDVLAGLLAALLARGFSAEESALIGVWAHLMAGREVGLGQHMRGFFASEIADALPQTLHRLAQF